MNKIKVGIIGFGTSGRFFHTPLLQGHGGYEIAMVSSSKPNEVKSVLPNAQVVSTVEDLLKNQEIDLVINCAPNAYHFQYAESALKSGKHVVVEKPFVNTLDEGKRLIALAAEVKKSLTVFQNRRWDADFLTVQRLLKENKFGIIKQFETHFDRWRPNVRSERWREQDGVGAGLFYDLGSHLIDQVLILFGMPSSVIADITQQKNRAKSDDYFHIVFVYHTMRVIIHASSFTSATPRFQIFGDRANFIKHGLDPQEEKLRAGIPTYTDGFGIETPENSGQLITPEEGTAVVVASEKGDYMKFYSLLYRNITLGERIPVRAEDALNVIKLIEVCFQSAKEGKTINVI